MLKEDGEHFQTQGDIAKLIMKLQIPVLIIWNYQYRSHLENASLILELIAISCKHLLTPVLELVIELYSLMRLTDSLIICASLLQQRYT